MALDLYYLMSAFSAGNYHWEQQAMSVALRSALVVACHRRLISS